MSQGQQVAKGRGLWEPRTRLKIAAGLSAFQCLTIGLQFLSSPQILPWWIDAALVLGNVWLAVMLWLVASAARPSPMLVGSAFAALFARIAVGGVSLASTRTGPDTFMIVLSILSGAAVVAFVYVTIRAIRAEASS